jgi:hypothetical protein
MAAYVRGADVISSAAADIAAAYGRADAFSAANSKYVEDTLGTAAAKMVKDEDGPDLPGSDAGVAAEIRPAHRPGEAAAWISRRHRDDIAVKWPPAKSEASRVFLDKLDSMIRSIDDARGGAQSKVEFWKDGSEGDWQAEYREIRARQAREAMKPL